MDFHKKIQRIEVVVASCYHGLKKMAMASQLKRLFIWNESFKRVEL